MKKLVIVIDDDEDDVDFIKEALKKLNLNHDIIWFLDGASAFDYLSTAPTLPYLILSDINMPVLSGFELRKRIVDFKNSEVKRVPFVFFTTTAEKSSVKLAYNLEVNGFFQKPVSFEGYVDLVSDIVKYWYSCARPDRSI